MAVPGVVMKPPVSASVWALLTGLILALAPAQARSQCAPDAWFRCDPSPRSSAAMVFDSIRGKVLVANGTNGRRLSDTWEWDGGSWTLRVADGLPIRTAHA